MVTKLLKIWVRDPGSGKNLFRIPDPGVKKAPDPGSGSATLHIARIRHRRGSVSLTDLCSLFPEYPDPHFKTPD
jgi:hypothetical protein